MAKKTNIIPGLSFSWKRAVGITALKQKIAKETVAISRPYTAFFFDRIIAVSFA